MLLLMLREAGLEYHMRRQLSSTVGLERNVVQMQFSARIVCRLNKSSLHHRPRGDT